MIDIINFASEISSGYNSNLFKCFNDVTISDVRIRDAFKVFIKNVECGESVSVIDLITSGEAVLNKHSIDENPGSLICVFDAIPEGNKKLKTLLERNSVGGLSALFSLNNGMVIDINLLGGSVASAELKRYLVVAPKTAEKIRILSEYIGLKIQPVGQIITERKIHLCNGKDIISTIDKTEIMSTTPTALKLGAEQFPDFLSGYKCVSSLKLCNLVSQNNFLDFGLDISMESLVARALGVFYATVLYKIQNVRIVYSSKSDINIAVSRPKVSEGDYFYLLRLRNDENQMPDKNHFAQLCFYLAEKSRLGIIKDVLPVRENIEKVLERLGNSSVEYVRLNSIPENSFGIIVSANRGESLNGIELGHFKYIE